MNNISNIENARLVIFDLGNVIIDVDVKNTILAFTRLGVKDIDKILTNSCAVDGVFLQLEKGIIDISHFCNEIRNLAKLTISDIDIINAMNAMIGTLDQKRVKFIEDLKKKYVVVLLSNTNEIHKKFFDSMANGYKSLSDLFDGTWYSHEMHLSKPSSEIFEQVLKYHGFKASEAVFFDDSEANVEGARRIGITSFVVDKAHPIESYFTNQQLD